MAKNIKRFKEALKEIYKKLKESPEKGFVVWIGQTKDNTAPQEYEPSEAKFIDDLIAEFDLLQVGSEIVLSEEQFIANKNKEYGLGPETILSDETQLAENTLGVPNYKKWYLETRTFLSKDEKYYIVPVVYENIPSNPALQPFSTNRKLQLYGEDGLLGIPEDGPRGRGDFQQSPAAKLFTDSAKAWALEKLAHDLAKAISLDHKKDAETMAFLPADSQKPDTPSGKTFPKLAEAWHIDGRSAEYQNLSLKMMFDRNWIDSLPSKDNPCVDLEKSTRTVMLFAKTLQQDLVDLEGILLHFAEQISDSKVYTAFDPVCSAGKVSKIAKELDKVLALNDKPLLSSTSPAAFTFGFTETLDLQYIAYSEEPDCLCDQNNINAYLLKKGVDELKINSPFDSQRINGFVYYIPEIVRKYASYLKGNKKKVLFSAQESWIRFMKRFVYPAPEVTQDTSETMAEFKAKKLAEVGKVTKKLASLTKQGMYSQDPLQLLAPDLRNRIVGAANQKVEYGGDDVLMSALTADIFDLRTLYFRLVNQVPITELIKIGVTAIVKCTPHSKFKEKLCEAIMGAMTINDMRTHLYPCLRQSPEGQIAIGQLEQKIGGRFTDVYAQARARFPEKFKKSFDPDTATGLSNEADIAAVNDLYCSDPEFRKNLGRPADDMSEEALKWLEEQGQEKLCECVLTSYGPVQQLLEFAEEMKDEVEDIIDIAGKNKSQTIEQQSTFPYASIRRIFSASAGSTDNTKGFGDAIGKAIEEAIKTAALATALVALDYAKDKILGGMLKDLCGAIKNWKQTLDPTDYIMNSSLYKDGDFAQLKKTLKKIGTMAMLSADINDLVSSLKELGRQFTPSEMKRLFNTNCGDNSFDAGYKKAAHTLAKNGVTFTSDTDTPLSETYKGGSPTAAAAAWSAAGGPPSEDALSCKPLIPEIPISNVHEFLNSVGAMIDDDLWEDAEEEFQESQARFADFCDPNTISTLADNINPEDVIKLAEKGQDDLLSDLVDMLPAIDPEKLENALPPIFCGPCSPQKAGKKPMLASQSHSTQLALADSFNKNLFQSVNELFNNNLSVYKQIILNDSGAAQDIFQLHIDLTKKYMPTRSDIAKLNFPKSHPLHREKDDKPEKYPSSDEMITKARSKAQSELIKIAGSDWGVAKYVAGGLKNLLETAAGNNQTLGINIPEFRLFVYDIPETTNQVLLTINFSSNAVTAPSPYTTLKTESFQIKIAVRNRLSGEIIYEFPSANGPPEDVHRIKDFREEDLTLGIFKTLIEKIPAMNSLLFHELGAGLAGAQSTFLTEHYPTIANLIFETIFIGGTENDLFTSRVFSKIPLTDEEMEESCAAGLGKRPFLDPASLAKDQDAARQALECIIGRFETPDATQIATVYGLYKVMIKICIVEEYIKNIFIFGFVKVADIVESPAYMAVIVDNIVDSIDASMPGVGYDTMLDYSEKIIQGRQQLGEVFPNATPPIDAPLGKIQPVLSKRDCLEILVKETAHELSETMTNRVQSIIDPTWTKKFHTFDDIDDPDVQAAASARLLQYAVLATPEYWSPSLFPMSPHENNPETTQKLSSMRPIQEVGVTDNTWPADSSTGWQSQNDWPILGGQPWGGGLFFQPYMRMKTKISGDFGDVEAKQEFWEKFKTAWEMKKTWEAENQFNFPAACQGGVLPNRRDDADAVISTMVAEIDNNGAFDFNKFNSLFFGLFFEPRAGTAGENVNETWSRSRTPFTRLVSSWIQEKQRATPSLEAGATPSQPYYHWGSDILPGGDRKGNRYHWLNRGAMSAEFALNSFMPSRTPATIHLFPPNPRDVLTFYDSHTNPETFLSAINMFGLAKEFRPGVTDATKSNGFLHRVAELHGIEASKYSIDGAADQFYNYKRAEDLWIRIRDIIYDSPYDLWFDFALGLRLNLLFPIIGGETESDLLKTAAAFMGEKDFAKINEEKIFVWEKTPTEKYLCMPIEEAEYDYDYTNYIENSEYLKSLPSAIWWNIHDFLKKFQDQIHMKELAPLVFTGSPTAPTGAPSLWALSRAMLMMFGNDKTKEKTLGPLKKILLKKIVPPKKLPEWWQTSWSKEPNIFVNELLPVRELLLATSFMYRFYIDGTYPALNQLFAPTKKALNRFIHAATQAINGDYSFANDAAAEAEGTVADPPKSPSNQEIFKKFLKLVVQAAANIADPTWKTPWFLPGPITPVGAIAKAMATKWSSDSDDAPTDVFGDNGEKCPPDVQAYIESLEEKAESVWPEPTATQLLEKKYAKAMAKGLPPPSWHILDYLFGDQVTNDAEWLKKPNASSKYSCGPGRLTLFDFPTGCIHDNRYGGGYGHSGFHLNSIGRSACKYHSKGYRDAVVSETPWHFLSDEAKRRAWQFHIARETGWEEPPPFYTSYNPVAWLAAGLDPGLAIVSYNSQYSSWNASKLAHKAEIKKGVGAGIIEGDNNDFAYILDARGTAVWGAREKILLEEFGEPASWEEACNMLPKPYKGGFTRPGHNQMHHPLARIEDETWWGFTNEVINTFEDNTGLLDEFGNQPDLNLVDAPDGLGWNEAWYFYLYGFSGHPHSGKCIGKKWYKESNYYRRLWWPELFTAQWYWPPDANPNPKDLAAYNNQFFYRPLDSNVVRYHPDAPAGSYIKVFNNLSGHDSCHWRGPKAGAFRDQITAYRQMIKNTDGLENPAEYGLTQNIYTPPGGWGVEDSGGYG